MDHLGFTLNIAVALMAVVLSSLMLPQMRRGLIRNRTLSNAGIMLYVCLVMFPVANLFEQILDGSEYRIPLYLASFSDYLFSGLLTFSVSFVLHALADPEGERRTARRLLIVLALAHIVMLIAAQFTGLYYTLDAKNHYVRSAAYEISLIPSALMVAVDIVTVIRARKRLSRRALCTFILFLAIPAVALVLQVFVQNIVPPAAIIAALVLYRFLVDEATAQHYRERERNAELQTEVMLSQIQPHFLSNMLGSIAELCDRDPQAAKETTLRFARYLRGNLEALSTEQPIPFAKELAHTKRYLELEQVRFGDALQVRYEIGTVDFSIPTLSLQPLAENAVRHGVRKKPDGRGTVVIRVEETADCYAVSVADDGPGYVTRRAPERDRIHLGIQNVRDRLRLTGGGTLEIVSEPGAGTVATIRVPKPGNGPSVG